MIFTTIWVIGYMFTMGWMSHETSVFFIVLGFLVWPLLLGEAVRKSIERK